MKLSPAALLDLKRRHPCEEIARRFVALRKHGRGFIGPCPLCSTDKQSRTATRFECDAEGFVCAVCREAGDVIALVEKTQGLEFRAAIDWLGGPREIDPAQAKKLEAEAKQKREARERAGAHHREQERARLWQTWNRAQPIGNDTAAAIYLARRGIPKIACNALRATERTVYYSAGDSPQRLHVCAALLAAIVAPNDKFSGLHFTYLEPDGIKAEISDPATGEILPAKKVRGSKQAGRIELIRCKDPKRLVLGEGIETVLSVWQALSELKRDLSTTAFWSAIDLGNLGGKALDTIAHPTLKGLAGRPQRIPGPEPDLNSPSIPIPESVTDIILLGDGDSDRFTTECALKRAAERYAKDGRTIRIAWAPQGQDFNDLLRAA